MLRIGIIGAGRIGARRAREVSRHSGCRLVAVADPDPARAQLLAKTYSCRATADGRALATASDIDAVNVATPHHLLAPLALLALESRKHVLCEKPLAMTPDEAMRLVLAADRSRITLKTGFNHRHHPAVWTAHQKLQSGAIGKPLWIRCRYGHGGRPGYEKEWRADPAQSGGGELLDQGIHVLDLFRWFLGEFSEVQAVLTQSFWPTPVEDNAFCLLRTPAGQVASLHASWTQWRNLFSFEVFGEQGYLLIDGLGGNYGPERLTIGYRSSNSSTPHEEHIQFACEDGSWSREWQEFVSAIEENRRPLADGEDGWQALRLAHASYESARLGIAVQLREEELCRTKTISAAS